MLRRYITQIRYILSQIILPRLSGVGYFFAMLGTVAVVTSHAQPVRLIVRGDDMGFTHAANEACIETFRQGIVRSVEVMVPTPWFPEAVKMLREQPDLDVGIHLTLTSEWENVKWKPLTRAPSLTDSMGYFYPTIWPNDNFGEDQALQGHSWQLAEVEQELRAQIELAKRTIPQLSHLTGHMGCHQLDERVEALVKKLAVAYKLDIFPEELGVLRVRYVGPKKTQEEKISSFLAMLEGLTPGTYLFVDHPAYDNAEVQAVYHLGYTDVANDRQGVTTLLTDPSVKEAIRRLGIQLVSYHDIAKP